MQWRQAAFDAETWKRTRFQFSFHIKSIWSAWWRWLTLILVPNPILAWRQIISFSFLFFSLSRQGQGQSCYQWPSGQSKPRFQSKTEICSALHTQRLNDIFGPGIAHVPALGFRSGRCLGIHAQVFSQICWGKWPFLQNVCFCLIK